MGSGGSLCWPQHAAAYFEALGFSCQQEGVFGDGDWGAFVLQQADPRIVLGQGWTTCEPRTAGGSLIASKHTVEPFYFSPTHLVDTFQVFYRSLQSDGEGSFSIFAGGARINVDPPDTGLNSVMLRCPPGANRLEITPAKTASSVYVAGIVAWTSNAAAIDIIQAGWNGSSSTDWVDCSQPSSPLAAINAIAPDLTVVALGINDQCSRTPVPLFRSNLARIARQAKRTGDALLVSPSPVDPDSTGISSLLQGQYAEATRDVAIATSCRFLDLIACFQDWESMARLGYAYDNLHPNGTGYRVMAKAIVDALTSP